jgi:hypothetical protein
MSVRHPSENDLALYAGGDCGPVQRFLLKRHVARCGDCRDSLASFGELRSAVHNADVPDLNWNQLATEMRANIRVGLAAGECVREVPVAGSHGSHWGWKPQVAVAMAGVLLLVGAGTFLHGLLPHENTSLAAQSAVLESTDAGVQVSNGTASMTLLNPGKSTGDQSITSQGAIRASYVDGNTGTVTVTSVYVE